MHSGYPNVGKSSLINGLMGKKVSIFAIAVVSAVVLVVLLIDWRVAYLIFTVAYTVIDISLFDINRKLILVFPRVGPGVCLFRIDPLHFLAGWRKRHLNQAFSFVLV